MTTQQPPVTVGYLRTQLAAAWGTNRQGRPNLTIPAGDIFPPSSFTDPALARLPVTHYTFGVTPATVRRWIHGNPSDPSPIPARQLSKLNSLDDESHTRERVQKRHRVELDLAIYCQRPAHPKRPPQRDQEAAWWRKGWYQPHNVNVTDIPAADSEAVAFQQVTVTKRGSANDKKFARSHPRVRIEMPTRWHAELVALLLLEAVEEDQVVAPAVAASYVKDRTWVKQRRLPSVAAIAKSVLADYPPPPK